MVRYKTPQTLQAKIILVLVAVILPTYLLVTVIQNKLIQPILEQELRQLGTTTGEALAGEIASNKLFYAKDTAKEIERSILQRLYFQPSIVRIDVYEMENAHLKFVVSSIDDDPSANPPEVIFSEINTGELIHSSDGVAYWKIFVPIKQAGITKKAPPKVIGMVRVLVSTKTVQRLFETFWKITLVGALINVFILIILLNFFLKKTIAKEKLLQKTESQNIQLSEQLHEAERQMMNLEKLAVMGQLTANFAHEIGTPLNAIGGHLQLLSEQVLQPKDKERLAIIQGQLTRIEGIVKNFLHTTVKPSSQKQLVELNSVIDKSLGILRPRIESMGIEVIEDFDRSMGPVRIVPTDVEQIFLNLFNNALDSLKEKKEKFPQSTLSIRITNRRVRRDGEDWAQVVVYDTGMGIKKTDMKNVMKPFFTTKQPGEGTGLGLNICQEIAGKYGGTLDIRSKEESWAQVTLLIPFQVNS